MWQLFAKRENLGPRKSFSMMQCLSDQPLCKTLKEFRRIWFFLTNGLLWIIWRQWNDLVFNALQWPIEKTRRVIRENLQEYGRIEWQWTLVDLEKALDTSYQDILNDFDSTWGVKGLIVTWSNLVVTWKVRPHMGIISWSPLTLRWFFWGDWIFNLCPNFIFQKENHRFYKALDNFMVHDVNNPSYNLQSYPPCIAQPLPTSLLEVKYNCEGKIKLALSKSKWNFFGSKHFDLPKILTIYPKHKFQIPLCSKYCFTILYCTLRILITEVAPFIKTKNCMCQQHTLKKKNPICKYLFCAIRWYLYNLNDRNISESMYA